MTGLSEVTMNNLDLDITESERLKADGMARAIASADRYSIHDCKTLWSRDALNIVIKYCKLFPHQGEFLTEDVRYWARSIGFREPYNTCAWGYVMKKAYNIGIIIPVGVGKSRRSVAHRAYTTIWKKAR
jgi:hypothetical protein